MVLGAKDGQVYIGYEATFGSGYTAGDVVLPINESNGFDVEEPEFQDEVWYGFQKLIPLKIWTKEILPSEVSVPGLLIDPFLMAMFFQYRAIDTWGAAAKEISGNMHTAKGSALQSMWMQILYKDQDGSNDIQNEYMGMVPIKYELIGEKGMLVKEIITFKVTKLDLTPSTDLTTANYSTTFIDSSFCFSKWDTNNDGFLAKTTSLTCTGGIDSSFASINIESYHLTLEAPYDTSQKFDEFHHSQKWRTTQSWQLDITGKLADDTIYADAKRALKGDDTQDRNSNGTIKVQIDSDTGYEKYIQFTNAYLSSDSCKLSLPAEGAPIEITATFKGGESTQASFSFKYDGATLTDDPSAAISVS